MLTKSNFKYSRKGEILQRKGVIMNYRCTCKDVGPLIPVRIGIEENGRLIGTVCFKQWCPKCRNSRLTDRGEVLYYSIKSDGKFTTDKLNFWVPESVPYQFKDKFIDTILEMEDRFKGNQTFTMDQVRQAYRGKYGSHTN